ncbi:MAG: LL-diaminopimelate aminotransferase [Clostridiales bacterium]|nr:LL-diaminopimelate aminotransferase [Clostridiales bacterium]
MNVRINDNYQNIKETYLFSEINSRVRQCVAENPGKKIIRLGIGDVTLPLAPVVVKAMCDASVEMGVAETFRGYPPESGYPFLKEAIAAYYGIRGTKISSSDIFVSDGAKSDIGNLVDILGRNDILIPDPVYPVYVDSNMMSGNTITLLRGSKENGFLPMPEEISEKKSHVIYLCSPNNPTGAVYTRDQLGAWVEYARETGSLIIYDSAYEAFISDDLPRSIYEIEGAKKCAVEVCSFSKFAGFTGVRCGWTVVPGDLLSSDGISLNKMWMRRQSTKFNGVSYPVQRAAEAALTPEGMEQCRKNIRYYRDNARLISDILTAKGVFFTGGTNSPYIWMECPGAMGSWEFFDVLLHEANIVGTPGEGFGKAGEGYFRLTAFGTKENTREACERLNKLL